MSKHLIKTLKCIIHFFFFDGQVHRVVFLNDASSAKLHCFLYLHELTFILGEEIIINIDLRKIKQVYYSL